MSSTRKTPEHPGSTNNLPEVAAEAAAAAGAAEGAAGAVAVAAEAAEAAAAAGSGEFAASARAFSGKVDTGFPQKMRPTKEARAHFRFNLIEMRSSPEHVLKHRSAGKGRAIRKPRLDPV